MSEKEILDIIQLVDRNRDAEGKLLFRRRDIFGGSFRSAIFIIGALFSLVIFLVCLRTSEKYHWLIPRY
jgi:hypothetical protein